MKKRNYIRMRNLILSLSSFICVLNNSTAQQTYTFTNAGATGRMGPTQTQVNSAYASTNLSGAVTVTGSGIQTWVAPYTGPYRITVAGAKGGDGLNGSTATAGGNGAIVRAEFTITAGSTLAIASGQMGLSSSSADTGGGGGGGSYVSIANNALIVAGGGGSGGDNNTGATSGTTYTYGLQGNNSGGAGGTGGGGGTGFGTSGGGGGFTTNGSTSAGGFAFLNGAVGGAGTYGDGGFGGGGGGNDASQDNGAGGGGYSGGGGGGNNAAGGGGGSYIGSSGVNLASSNGLYNGNTVQNLGSFNTGHGYVIIEELCNISLTAAGASNSISPVICSGQSLTLTTNAVANYSWSTGVTGTNQIVLTPSSNTVISVSGQSSLSCTAGRSMSITVSTGPPVLSVAATSNSVCLGDSVAITASGALTYVFSHSVVSGVYFHPTGTTTYSVSGTNGCGTANATTVINVYQLPVLAIVNPTQVCANNAATLTAGGAQTYTWMPGNLVGNNLSVAPGVSTTYTVTGKSGGCLGQNTVQLLTKPIPTITTVATKSIICDGETVTITVNGASSYTWTNSSLSGSVVTVTPSVPIAYDVSGTNSLGCTSSAQQIVIAYPRPPVTASASPTLICVGASASLSASGADSYSWSHGPGSAGTVVSPVSTTTYVVTGTESVNGCTTAVSVPVNVYQATIAVSQNTSVCPGGSVVISAGPATSYTWMHGGSSASSTVSPSSATIYTINATGIVNNMTCIRTNTVQIGVFPPAVVTATAHRTTICRNETTTLTASGGNTYLWNTGSTSSVVVITGFTAGPLQYTVTGTDQNSCKAAYSLTVTVSNCTGIAEGTYSGSIRVYPNPSAGAFTIECASGSELVIMNSLGEIVRNLDVTQFNNGQVLISDLSKGVYFISMKNDSSKSLTVIVE